jgi:multicomponent Na+:H+ antiporter subunit B
MKSLPIILVLLMLTTILVVAIRFDRITPEVAKTYFYQHGSAETGAINLVTSIYLGYRAFDTFGETIVFFLSIAGVIFFLENNHAQN